MESKILCINDYKRRKGIQKMGIKLTYQQLNSEGMNHALMTLANQNGYASVKAAYNVMRIKKQFDKALKEARELYNKLTDEFLVKDESGKPVPATTPNAYSPYEIIPARLDEFNKKIEEFLQMDVEIQSYPVKADELGSVKLSPQQMIALDNILDVTAFEPVAEGSDKT